MTEQTGLRFDIYERVHLADGLAEIKVLDEVELLPHIQVFVEGDQALLRGNLWLTGRYIGEMNEENHTLEHFIPVEISLPMNRVNRLEDIAVEIENFDIDLLSNRSLNVTGVLSLRGVELVSAERYDLQGKVPPNLEQPEMFKGDGTLSSEGAMLESIEEEPPVDLGMIEETLWLGQGVTPPTITPTHTNPTNMISNEIPVAQLSLPDEQKELKIAFGSKSPTQQNDLFRLKSLLQSEDQKKLASRLENDERLLAESKEGIRGDELEFRKLFLDGQTPEQQFRKVRLCIVQKEETIEGIAERYRMNPREIILYNRLNGHDVAVGQVIYIP